MNKSLRSSVGSGGKNSAVVNGGAVPALSTDPNYFLPFFHYLTIPKSTTQTSPLTYALALPVGVIRSLWIEFPRGCSGLAGFSILRGPRQIFPLPDGVWLRSDNAVMRFAFSHDMLTEPHEIVLRGYNDDDTYQHTIWVGVEMSGSKRDLPPALLDLVNYLSDG